MSAVLCIMRNMTNSGNAAQMQPPTCLTGKTVTISPPLSSYWQRPTLRQLWHNTEEVLYIRRFKSKSICMIKDTYVRVCLCVCLGGMYVHSVCVGWVCLRACVYVVSVCVSAACGW